VSTFEEKWRHGAEGVQSGSMMQSDLGRTMGAPGASNLARLTRGTVRIHRR